MYKSLYAEVSVKNNLEPEMMIKFIVFGEHQRIGEGKDTYEQKDQLG